MHGRLWSLLALSVVLSGCSLLDVFGPKDEPSPRSDWITGALSTEVPSRTYSFDITPGKDYYLNWEDAYIQRRSGVYTQDIMVTVYYRVDNEDVDLYTEIDSGWCGSSYYEDGDHILEAVDDTITLTATELQQSGITKIYVDVVPYSETPANGTFHLRWATTPLPGYGEGPSSES